MAEGFLDITQIVIKDTEVFPTKNPVSMSEGEQTSFNIKVKNLGATDDFKLEIWGNGNLLRFDEFSCPAGVEDWVYLGSGLVLTMGNESISITIKTYHYVEAVGWVWDTSSVWELLFPFMNIHAQPYKQ